MEQKNSLRRDRVFIVCSLVFAFIFWAFVSVIHQLGIPTLWNFGRYLINVPHWLFFFMFSLSFACVCAFVLYYGNEERCEMLHAIKTGFIHGVLLAVVLRTIIVTLSFTDFQVVCSTGLILLYSLLRLFVTREYLIFPVSISTFVCGNIIFQFMLYPAVVTGFDAIRYATSVTLSYGLIYSAIVGSLLLFGATYKEYERYRWRLTDK